MTKEEIQKGIIEKACDVLSNILGKHLHGGEADEVIAEFEEEMSIECAEWTRNQLSREWIPVEERLPEYGQSVLVYVNGTRVITTRTKKDYSKDKYDFIHVVIADDATHWMPLPTPPSK